MAKHPPRRPHGKRTINSPHGVYSCRDACELSTLCRQTIYVPRKKRSFPEGRKRPAGRIVRPEAVIRFCLAGDPLEPDEDGDGVRAGRNRFRFIGVDSGAGFRAYDGRVGSLPSVSNRGPCR